MNETLPNKISRIEQELHDLGEAIEICKNPPTLKIDESAYPALAETRRLLAEAQNKQDAEARLALLEDQLQGRKTEIARLRQVLQSKKQTIETLKSEQATAFERFKSLESELLQQLQILMGFGQALAAQESDLIQPCKPGVIFAVNTKIANRLQDISIADGRVVLSVKNSGVIDFVSDGFGGNTPIINDYQHLIPKEEQAA